MEAGLYSKGQSLREVASVREGPSRKRPGRASKEHLVAIETSSATISLPLITTIQSAVHLAYQKITAPQPRLKAAQTA